MTVMTAANRRLPTLSPPTGRRLFGLVILYTLFFTFLPNIARTYPFELMFFGEDRPAELEAALPDRYINFAYALIGAVMTGWFATLWVAMKAETRGVWNAGLFGLALWYVLDSAASVTWGFGMNVLTNTAFFLALVGVLLASRPRA
jgi:hypothetical protein